MKHDKRIMYKHISLLRALVLNIHPVEQSMLK